MRTIETFSQKMNAKEKITMVTCYDYTTAKNLNRTEIDALLIGDSAGMVMLGHDSTINTTMEHIILFTKAVAKGATRKLLIADLPFMSYRESQSTTTKNATRLIQAGAHAVKLEGAAGNLETIQHLVESGIPVMGHIGLTPQLALAIGGFKLQGKSEQARKKLIKEAKQLEDAGCFSLVLECIPAALTKKITIDLNIPTIGIGAGPETDGQILVIQDLLGLQSDFKPKFVKQYIKGDKLMMEAIQAYVGDVQHQRFPTKEYSYEGKVK